MRNGVGDLERGSLHVLPRGGRRDELARRAPPRSRPYFQWLAYATAQVLSNPPVVLGTLSGTASQARSADGRCCCLLGASINCVLLVAYYFPSGLWWVLHGGILGSFDATCLICNAIVVDHASHGGVVAGGADDRRQLLRAAGVPAHIRRARGGGVAPPPRSAITPPPLRPGVWHFLI